MAMRLYTVEEARSILPGVIEQLRTIQRCFRELRALLAAREAAGHGVRGDGHLVEDAWSEGGTERERSLNTEMQAAASKLAAWGVELKDPDRGLVDFRHEREGRVVYLCYELGEPGIGHWHELDAGFAGRQPL
jgi:hypothetical protein